MGNPLWSRTPVNTFLSYLCFESIETSPLGERDPKATVAIHKRRQEVVASNIES